MGKKRVFLTAVEAEKEMQEARVGIGFCGSNEKIIVDNMLKTAKNNSRIGDKMLMVVDPKMIHIPEWQRKIRLDRAYEIGNGYNRYKWNVPKVLLFKNKLYVIDGQHRIYGTFKANKEDVVVEVLECSQNEAIKLFLNQSDDIVHMKPEDILKAALVLGEESYVTLVEVCHNHNVNLIGEKKDRNTVGTVTSITDALKIIERYPGLLDSILELIGKLSWNGYATTYNGKAYTRKILNSLCKLYAYHADHKELMEKALLENCTGTEFFVENIMTKSRAQVFDYLNAVVTRELYSTKKSRSKSKILKMAQ